MNLVRVYDAAPRLLFAPACLNARGVGTQNRPEEANKTSGVVRSRVVAEWKIVAMMKVKSQTAAVR